MTIRYVTRPHDTIRYDTIHDHTVRSHEVSNGSTLGRETTRPGHMTTPHGKTTRPRHTVRPHDHTDVATAMPRVNTVHDTTQPGNTRHTTRHVTRKHETCTKPTEPVHRTSYRVTPGKAQTPGCNQGKQGPVGVKKVVPV